MKTTRSLEDFPKLNNWYHLAMQNPPEVTDHIATLIYNTCRALDQDHEAKVRMWMHSLEIFFKHNAEAQFDFIRAEKTFQDLEVDFFVLASELAELALHTAKGPSFESLMSSIADKSQLSVFRFFSAWTALNIGELELCIDECERITDPFACVYTLQGQAYLEVGLLPEALESLKLATELSPQEVLAHFQLAKAYFTAGNFEDAWQSLGRCDQLVPNHPEVQGFAAMIALRIDDAESRLAKMTALVPKLVECLSLEKENIDFLFLTLDIIFHLNNEEAMLSLVEIADWSYYRTQPQFMLQIATILRELDKKNWRGVSLALLTKLSPESASA